MSSEKSLAIVLRVVDFSETSCVVTLFTRDFGKLGALAKGARRPKSPFEAALDLLSVCRIVFLHKSSDSLDLLTEAKLERRFRAGTRDLSRLYAGYYVDELLCELTDAADPHPELFDAAVHALSRLDGDGDVFGTVLWFELTALRILGHAPALDACVGCGGEVATTGRVAFGQLAGGLLCATCRVGQRQVASISQRALAALRIHSLAVAGGDASYPPGTASYPPGKMESIERSIRGELRGLLNHYLSNLMGRRPRMVRYLGMLAD